jgi:PAS domain S-box-containing protein
LRHFIDPDVPQFLSGGGETGALMRSMNWTESPLGPPAHWPQSLRTVVGLMLNSKFPMFVAWGSELGFLYNDKYAEILGAKHPEAMGRRFTEVWSEIWEDIQPLIDKALAGEATYSEDLPLLVRRNGFEEQAYFTFSYSPLHDESGGVGGMFCAVTETTEEIAARSALQADRDDLERLFIQAPGFIAVLRGPEHVFDIVNDAYLQLVGHRDLIGKSVRSGLPEVATQGFIELLDQVYESGEPFVGRRLPVKLLRDRSGEAEDRYVDFVYQPVTDIKNAVTGIFVSGYDVTEQVRAEDALRRSEERLRGIFMQATGGIAQVDVTGRFTLVNKRYCEIVGYSEDELLTMSMQEITHAEDRPENVTLFKRLIEAGESFIIEKRYVRKDGTDVWVNNSVAPVRDASGRVGQVVAMVVDMTERKQAEHLQRTLVNELNHRVKNTLATVQAIARQTFRGEQSSAARETFEARLQALSNAHNLLTRENWLTVSIADLVEEVLAPYHRQRLALEGPDLRLEPRVALALSMVLHELATNAAKYGALSASQGMVVITWTVDDAASPGLSFRWEERGGPPVEPPTRTGFGSRLIERGLSAELDGEARIIFAPEGVVCEIKLRLDDAGVGEGLDAQ